jgi:sortase A
MREFVAYTAMAAGCGFMVVAGAIALPAQIGQTSLPMLHSLPSPVLEAMRIQPEAPRPAAVFRSLRLNRRLNVYAGFKDALYYGPEWIHGSPAPGSAGNTIIAGHRDTHFRFLKDVKTGDLLQLDYAGQRFHYRITRLKIVDKTDLSVLQPTPRPTLTLVTCYPFYYIGAAPKRFIVSALLQDAVSH